MATYTLHDLIHAKGVSEPLRQGVQALCKDYDELMLRAANQALTLMEQHNAVKKLHDAKGRYHTQLAICDLFELHGLPCERPKK